MRKKFTFPNGRQGEIKIEYDGYRGYPFRFTVYSPNGHSMIADSVDRSEASDESAESYAKVMRRAEEAAAKAAAVVVEGYKMGDRFEIPASAKAAKADTGIFEVDHASHQTVYGLRVMPSGRLSKNYRYFGRRLLGHAVPVGAGARSKKVEKKRAKFTGCATTYDAILARARTAKLGEPIQVRWKYRISDTGHQLTEYEVAGPLQTFREGRHSLPLTNAQLRTRGGFTSLDFWRDPKRGDRIVLPRSRGAVLVTGISLGSMVAAEKVAAKKRDYSARGATIPKGSKLYEAVILNAKRYRRQFFDSMTDGSRWDDPVENPTKEQLKYLLKDARDRASGAKMWVSEHGSPLTRYVLYWFSNMTADVWAPPVAELEAMIAAKKARSSKPRPAKTASTTYTIEVQRRGEWTKKKGTGTYSDIGRARVKVEAYRTAWRIVEHRNGSTRVVARSNGNGHSAAAKRVRKYEEVKKRAQKAGKKTSAAFERVLAEEQRRLTAALKAAIG